MSRRSSLNGTNIRPSEVRLFRLRIASFVMAIIGVVFGIMFGLIAMAVGGIGNAVDEGSGNQVIWLGVSAILACVFAMVCSGLHFSGRSQGWAATGLFVAAFWHLISISAFGVPGFIFLLLAAVFAAFGRGNTRYAPAY